MASGLPVVCINDESFVGTVKNNIDGIIFDNQKEYIKAVEKLYKDKKLLSKLGENAKIDSEKYSSSNFAKSVLEVYKIAIKNNKKIVIPLVEKIKGALKNNE